MNDRYSTSKKLFERAARVIPGGIYGSKAPGFLVPGFYPYYMDHAKGSHMWDVDGNEFIDFLCGFGSQIVGYGNENVDRPALERIARGDLLDQPTPAMVELAERLTGLITGSAWAVFTKNGTDATGLALSIARVYTEKPLIIAAKEAYHGAANWTHSNPFPILRNEREDVLDFEYNDIEALEELFRKHKGQIAALILTPYHHRTYKEQLLPDSRLSAITRRLCDEEGALLIMDDIRANFRIHRNGSHMRFGMKPDLWCMGKALANGYPISVLLGSEELKKTASSFFITGTYWMSAGPMVASLACLDEMERLGGIPRLEKLGNQLKEGIEAAGRAFGYTPRISGPPAIPFLTFDEDPNLYLNQRFAGAMAMRGIFIHPHHNWFLSLAHTEEDIEKTVEAARESFKELRESKASVSNPG